MHPHGTGEVCLVVTLATLFLHTESDGRGSLLISGRWGWDCNVSGLAGEQGEEINPFLPQHLNFRRFLVEIKTLNSPL